MPALATDLTESSSFIMNVGNAVKQATIAEMRSKLNDNDEMILEEMAFFIDVNTAHSTSAYSKLVNTGGNMHMRQLWEDAAVTVLMDSAGNYCELNPADNRYTKEGTCIVNDPSDNESTLISALAGADVMRIIPETYGRVQDRGDGSKRLWLSLVPLPGGYIIPRQVVGKFKCTVSDSKLRSIPGAVPTASQTIKGFWDYAQARSNNHGLANADFRNHLLFHMMAKYGWRSSQECANSQGTLIWGVGLDGSENTESSSTGGFDRQKNIKTGATLSLGSADGPKAVADSVGGTAHSVNVAGFENPWGQYWEMVQGLCSVGNNVYFWRNNFMPPSSPAPTASTFEHVDHVLLTRYTTSGGGPSGMNIKEGIGQGVYMVPESAISNVTYGDYYYYDASGQLWLFGGYSGNGSDCGLASAYSSNAWAHSDAGISARLAYYGNINRVSEARLRELLS